MKRTPIRRVSTKRRRELAKYSELRKIYLADNPWCQIFMLRFGIDPAEVRANNGAYKEVTYGGMVHWRKVPLAVDIHHTNGRTGARLNDMDYWLSASRTQHEWVHQNPSKAREIGALK